jgi:signal transduction histidine kinase
VTNRRENGTIGIHIFDSNGYVETHLCNNGGNIPTDILSHIFDPYFSTKEEKSGRGLGLYMSKTIVEKHLNGMISVENIGDGVCFSIKFPLIVGRS